MTSSEKEGDTPTAGAAIFREKHETSDISLKIGGEETEIGAINLHFR